MDNVIFDTVDCAAAHLTALKVIAHADGEIHPKEKQFLEGIAAIYCQQYTGFNLDATSKELDETLDEALATMTSRKNKLILLQDAFSLASIDGNVDQHEESVLGSLAKKMNIDQEDLNELIALNKQLLEANQHLAKFLFQSSGEGASNDH